MSAKSIELQNTNDNLKQIVNIPKKSIVEQKAARRAAVSKALSKNNKNNDKNIKNDENKNVNTQYDINYTKYPKGFPRPKYLDDEMEKRITIDVQDSKIEINGIKDYEYNLPTTSDGIKQTSPPSIPLCDIYNNNNFPKGEIVEYAQDWNTYRITDKEKHEKEKPNEEQLNKQRQASEAHRQARQDIQRFIKPGMSLTDIAVRIERVTRNLLGKYNDWDLNRGWGFPTGLSINHIAAHFTPNSDDRVYLNKDDIIKIDFGTQIDGYIIDCAFTAYFDDKFDPLAKAVKEATETGLRVCGIDMRLGDIGGAIQEVMESYEIELNGITYPIKCIRNLNGHNLLQYQIHGGKTVPIVNNHDQTKMEEGEIYAIETFGTTGTGFVHESGIGSHYARSFNYSSTQLRNLNTSSKKLLYSINTKFSSIPFCRRWLDDMGETKHLASLKQLVSSNIVNEYLPLLDKKGSYTAQYEHTVYLRPTCKEILSRGLDF